MKVSSSRFDNLPKAPPPDTITSGVSISARARKEHEYSVPNSDLRFHGPMPPAF